MVNRTNTNKIDASKYEAFMRTGERVIKMFKKYSISLLPEGNQKVDWLVKNCYPNKFQKVNSDSVPSSPLENDRPNIVNSMSGSTLPVSSSTHINIFNFDMMYTWFKIYEYFIWWIVQKE